MRPDDLLNAETRAQERADRRANDELEAILDASQPDDPVLELATDATRRAQARRSADPAALVAEMTNRVNGPAEDDEIRAEPEKGSYAWRARELDRMGIRSYGVGGSH